jgi:hypothetical protein
MTSRRGFIQASVAMATAGAISTVAVSLGSRPTAQAANRTNLLKPHAVVVDQRFAESVEFGRTLALLGAHTYAMRGDVTDVWYSQLYPLWKAGGVAIAGLTGSGVLFCLERLAWDHGLRVVHRGSHQPYGENGIQHAMLGAADPGAMKVHAAGRTTPWATALATSISQMESPCRAVPTDLALRPICATRRADKGANSALFSWVIAPPARA